MNLSLYTTMTCLHDTCLVMWITWLHLGLEDKGRLNEGGNERYQVLYIHTTLSTLKKHLQHDHPYYINQYETHRKACMYEEALYTTYL